MCFQHFARFARSDRKIKKCHFRRAVSRFKVLIPKSRLWPQAIFHLLNFVISDRKAALHRYAELRSRLMLGFYE